MAERLVEHLVAKYRVMLELRVEREGLEAEGVLRLDGRASEIRQAASRSLSKSFPGALKQLDQMPAALIRQRLDVLEGLENAPAGPVPEWCALEHAYHQVLRDLLAAKRWLGEHGSQGLSDDEIYEKWREAGLLEASAWGSSADGQWVELIARPPGGRLSELVWQVLQESFRVPANVLKADFSSWQEGS